MRTLADAAQKIEQVIKLIQAIAGQTSLLALNATIEAARAGESGRGFAVVAAEVKELSRRTAKATEEVSEQIHGIQQAVHDAAAAILAVDHSVAAMGGVNDNINTIIEQQIAQLGRIGSEAMKVAADVSQTLPGIRAVVSDVATAGDAVLATAEDLIGRAESLADSVSRYFADLDHGSIKVGILHSLSGTLTASERPLQQLLVMMIEKLNKQGGLLGRPVEAVIMDPRSDVNAYAEQTRAAACRPQSGGDLRLLDVGLAQARVAGLGRARRAVVLSEPIRRRGAVAQRGLYRRYAAPAGAAGGRSLAASRAQALLPGRHRLHLSAHHQRHHPQLSGFSRGVGPDAVDELYVPFGEKSWQERVHAIRRFAGRDGAIIATLSGDSNVHFFRERARQGLDADILPVMSLSLGEAEMPALYERNLVGHMVAWNYLHAMDTPENHAFIEEWRQFTGDPNAVTNDPMEASWIGFKLWTQAVTAAGTIEVEAVRKALAGRSVRAPCGFDVRVDAENQHLHKPAVIGRMDEKNFIWPVWVSPTLIAPEPWSQWLPMNTDAGSAVHYAQSA